MLIQIVTAVTNTIILPPVYMPISVEREYPQQNSKLLQVVLFLKTIDTAK